MNQKLDPRAFAFALTVFFAVLVLVITIWTRVPNSSFGQEFMDAFNSVHPHPFRASLEGLTFNEHIYGVVLDLFYTIMDALIFSLVFSFLYNWMSARSSEPSRDDDRDE